MSALCCLTLIVPQALEEQVTDLLLMQDSAVQHFITSPAEAHGADIVYAGAAEHVRARALRVQMQIILPDARAHTLLAALRQALPRARIKYWLTPVSESGDFAK